ncbi:site-specific integrase [Halobacteria archaeon AArc-m2/3/4]|uniref:Site-specific integrase n=1 Tax=Natronoglomus mannanivorans TaxID=2979990 RepID=A0ABT2QGQ5_9EURY|nr:site-specific integrase [Halobacteria archaeon AArc-m2/3/4]
MTDHTTPETQPVDTTIDHYLETLTDRSQLVVEPVLEEWREQFALEEFEAVDTDLCREYSRYLNRQVDRDDRELSAATAQTYFAYVRAFLSFAVRENRLDTNPADANRATELLPDDDGKRDRQFWTATERRVALEYCTRRVDSALTPPIAPTPIVRERLRNRAIVAVLGFTGVRGAEVFAVPGDDRRDGLTWADVDIDGNTLTVFGKSQSYQTAQLPDRAASALERYRRVLEQPTEAWPVFPTNHYPSKRRALTAAFSDERVETMLERRDIDEILREHELAPPSLSTNGVRSILKRLTAQLAGYTDAVEYDEDENVYLKPHGARRGLGHELYTKGSAELAQSALRHQSVDVTHESYSDIQTADVADRVGAVLEDDS